MGCTDLSAISLSRNEVVDWYWRVGTYTGIHQYRWPIIICVSTVPTSGWSLRDPLMKFTCLIVWCPYGVSAYSVVTHITCASSFHTGNFFISSEKEEPSAVLGIMTSKHYLDCTMYIVQLLELHTLSQTRFIFGNVIVLKCWNWSVVLLLIAKNVFCFFSFFDCVWCCLYESRNVTKRLTWHFSLVQAAWGAWLARCLVSSMLFPCCRLDGTESCDCTRTGESIKRMLHVKKTPQKNQTNVARFWS